MHIGVDKDRALPEGSAERRQIDRGGSRGRALTATGQHHDLLAALTGNVKQSGTQVAVTLRCSRTRFV
jgi:hypothetical protein